MLKNICVMFEQFPPPPRILTYGLSVVQYELERRAVSLRLLLLVDKSNTGSTCRPVYAATQLLVGSATHRRRVTASVSTSSVVLDVFVPLSGRSPARGSGSFIIASVVVASLIRSRDITVVSPSYAVSATDCVSSYAALRRSRHW